MAVAKKKATVKAEESAEAPAAKVAETNSTAVAPLAHETAVKVYRTDLGEALPPQKYAGVE